MSLLLLFNQFNTAFEYLPKVEPSRANQVLGVMTDAGTIYCRVDMDKQHIIFNDDTMKYITYRHTLHESYNCVVCGFRISLMDMRHRYQHRSKIGKRGYN